MNTLVLVYRQLFFKFMWGRFVRGKKVLPNQVCVLTAEERGWIASELARWRKWYRKRQRRARLACLRGAEPVAAAKGAVCEVIGWIRSEAIRIGTEANRLHAESQAMIEAARALEGMQPKAPPQVADQVAVPKRTVQAATNGPSGRNGYTKGLSAAVEKAVSSQRGKFSPKDIVRAVGDGPPTTSIYAVLSRLRSRGAIRLSKTSRGKGRVVVYQKA